MVTVKRVKQATVASEGKKSKKRFRLPHVVIMMFLIMMFACLLTYIIPAGSFQLDDAGKIIPGTFEQVENTPVNPFEALTLILQGGIAGGSVVTVVFFTGGLLGGIFTLDSISKVITSLIYRFENAGPRVLVLGMFLLMAFIGFFIGGDMMIVFVTLGVILAKKLKLDPIAALAVTFLPLFMAFSIAPAGEAKIAQIFAGIPLFSGYLGRTLMFLLFMSVTAAYVTFYAKRIFKDPSKSAMGNTEWLNDIEEDKKGSKDLDVKWQDFAVLLVVIIAPITVAVGNFLFRWADVYSNGPVITVFLIAFVIAFLLKRKSIEDMIAGFSKGLQDMVIVIAVIILARTVSVILEKGNILNTIVNGMTSTFADYSNGVTAIFIFIAALLFNFLVPSGNGMSGIMMPILQPVADVLGMTDQVLVTAIQFGGGLGNLIIPTLGATMGAIAIAKANFGAWIKFMVPLFLIWMVLCMGILYYISSIGWTGY